MSEENEEILAEELEAKIKEMLSQADGDFSELTDFIEEHEEDYDDDLAEYAFREAVRTGNTDYVDEFAQNIDLNDGDGCSTYLYETDDEEMQELLMDHGAFRSWEDYDDCLFAVETVNGEILSFEPEFQKEAFEQYKEKFDLTDEKIMKVLGIDTDDEEDNEEDDFEIDRYVEDDMEALGVSFEDGEPQFMDMVSSSGMETMELLEELGWSCSFEGDSWQLETVGVYFIREKE